MSLRSQLGSLRRKVLGSVCSSPAVLGDSGPIVSFSFDDFPRSAVTEGGTILKNFGARGTYYASISLMNTCNELGEQFRREDLDALLADGHELGSHTFGHISCRSVSSSQFAKDVEKGRQTIQELTGREDSANFAFPFGDVTLGARRVLNARLASCRSNWRGLNGRHFDLSLLRANSLYGQDDSAAKQLIVENERRSSWLIFYTHDVRPNPSKFGCSPSLLESVVSFAVRRGSRVMTVADVLGQLSQSARQFAGDQITA
jgi:peptidoglycan/xylan/chitin deacetylase (PgdA/CDA1 family)